MVTVCVVRYLFQMSQIRFHSNVWPSYFISISPLRTTLAKFSPPPLFNHPIEFFVSFFQAEATCLCLLKQTCTENSST